MVSVAEWEKAKMRCRAQERVRDRRDEQARAREERRWKEGNVELTGSPSRS